MESPSRKSLRKSRACLEYLMLFFKIAKQNKLKLILFLTLLIVTIFFRFYKISDYVVFLGDEGRDALVLKAMIVDHKIPFLGPTASVGGFYLGPIYYYMTAPFLAIWQLNPIGPSYMVAVLGALTVLLLFKFLKEVAGFYPAFLASLLYSTAPLIVRYSRSSWNPNPLPFFALLLIYFLYLGITKNKLKYFLFAGLCFGVAIQLHYLASVLVAISVLIILLNTNFKKWFLIFLASLAGFLITFSPFLLFEVKHHFPNFITIREFVTRGTTVGIKNPNFVWLISSVGNIFLENITKLTGTPVTRAVFWLLTLGGFFGLATNWPEKNKKIVFQIAIIWFFGSLLGIRAYTGQVFDYYFGFMFPAPFLLLGLIFSIAWPYKPLKITAVSLTILALTWFGDNAFYKSSPNRLINQTRIVANFVIEKTDNKPYNFGLISDHNSDHAYRYFLEIGNHKPLELETLITDQLLVVCESEKCAPLGNPNWEIAGFGRAEIAGEWEIPNIGIKVFRLVHWPGAPSPAGRPAIKGI